MWPQVLPPANDHAEGSAARSAWLDAVAARLSPGRRIVLAEGDDPRVRRAANLLIGYGVTPLLITGTGSGRTDPKDDGVDLHRSVKCVDADALAAGPVGDRAERAIGAGWAAKQPLGRRHPLLLAAALVELHRADAVVAGCRHATADVLRAALAVIGLKPGASTLSSSFILDWPQGKTLAFGDCAVVPEPTADELAEIAIATADTFSMLTGQKPAVAMLSFSTHGSAEHTSVRLVRAATDAVRRRAPDLAIDGELQFDAALVESVARLKAPDSVIAGRANVFVFPNLSAANIGYKIAHRLGGASAFGPIVQGLNAPMNDLSRGCSTSDVVSVALISALQATHGAG